MSMSDWGWLLFVLDFIALVVILTYRYWVWPFRSVSVEAPKEQISIIFPFESQDPYRLAIFGWVLAYWQHEMPDAQIIQAGNSEIPFHKTKAVNDGVAQATGDVVVIMDGDCYMSGATLNLLADRIRVARNEGRKLWYIPYRRFYRLTRYASDKLMETTPEKPLQIPDPPPKGWVQTPETASSGHYWGALIQVMPIEAFNAAGGMDLRFQGWGGEDLSFMQAVDTIWARHKTYNGPVFHIWHPTIQGNWKYTRQWPGQPTAEMNDKLSSKYTEAFGDPAKMRELMGI